MSIRNPVLPAMVATVFLVLASASGALGQAQSKNQQKCLNGINKDGSLVAKQQGKESLACIKDAGKGKLVGTAQACLTADAKGKVQKKKDKTVQNEAKKCIEQPDFGHTGAAVVNDAAMQAELDLVADVFGPDLDAAVIDCDVSKDGCGCQQKVSKSVEKQVATKLKEFLKCKKEALKNGATSAVALADCVNDAGTPGSIAADTKGKVAKGVEKIAKDVVKKCDEKGVTDGFPGDCTGLSGSPLAVCLDVLVECRVCQMINEMDGLFVNCDLFDNGTADASCESGTGPTPTPTVTPTPIPSVTSTPVELQGALTSTIGRFNYNLTLGLPGADSACNTNFPGTHACTYPELLAAEAAGDLAGLQDIASNTVTTFWAIDSSHNPQLQCIDDVVGGSFLNWEYATAHTGTFGERVALNNPAGTLGPLQAPASCGGSNWVGCCL